MTLAASAADTNRDDRLAVVLNALLKQQADGKPIDFDAVAREHPDLVGEMKQLLAVGQMIDFVQSTPTITQPLAGRASDGSASPSLARPANFALPASFGDYELLAEIGRGGMGVVYKALDRKLNRHVALKVIQHGRGSEEKRFLAEIQIAGSLAHPNIVPVYQEGEVGDCSYYCMRYVEGKTLAARMADKPLHPRDAARYMIAIARGVQFAHEAGILHRDLKPSNILIDAGDQPLITDFGLAKYFLGEESLTQTGAIVGTPSYMAPEQADGAKRQKPLTAACDIYSLGAILYQLLTGRPPFLAASAVETLLLVRTEEPVRPRALNPQIDMDLEFICRKCLEKQPEHRYASAAKLADDLEAFLKGEPVSARSSSLVYFISRVFRDTHHAPILENWGLLWMWHSLKIFSLCAVTSLMHWAGREGHWPMMRAHWPYMALWSVALVVWGVIFMNLRRRGGPVTFVERQIAHAWGAGVTASIGIFVIEIMLGLDVLTLTPILSIAAGMVFLFKAGTLSGWFYVAALLCFVGAAPMAMMGPPWSPLLFGAVSAVGFFVPGLKYYRQRLQSLGE